MKTDRPPRDLLEGLGVSPDHVRVLAAAESEIPRKGQGLSSEAGPVLALSESFAKVKLTGALPAFFAITAHQIEADVFRLEELQGSVKRLAGHAAHDGKDVRLDARSGRTSGVLVETAEGRMVIVAGLTGVTVSSVDPPEDLSALENWAPLPEQLSIAVPSLNDLVGPCAVEPWLTARFGELRGSERMADRVAAVGLVLRLWTPVGADRSRAIDPGPAVAKWARSIPRRELDATERVAIERAGDLREELDSLPERDDLTAGEVAALAHERDVLESVLVVLRLADRGRPLRIALAGADDSAITSMSAIPSEALSDDELLGAAGVADHDAWWGRLADE